MEFNKDALRSAVYQTDKKQHEIASEMGVNAITLSKWINGHNKPKARELEKILKVFPNLRSVLDTSLTEGRNNPQSSIASSAPDNSNWQEVIKGLKEQMALKDAMIDKLMTMLDRLTTGLGKLPSELDAARIFQSKLKDDWFITAGSLEDFETGSHSGTGFEKRAA